MALLLFALDLRTLSPPFLSQLKQCLLELANLYAFSASTSKLKRRKFDSSLEDRIGLCYLQHSAASSSDELKVVYSPRGSSFSLCDFHYAVNHLPSYSYSPPLFEDSGSNVLNHIVSDEVLNSAGGKDSEKKLILISSCLLGNLDYNAKKTLMDAADRCISVEFLFLEQKSSQLSDISENINKFKEQICDLENCSFNAYLPDGQVFNGLAKRWLRELTESTEELLEANFLFEKSIAGSVNRICCRLCGSINQIMDGFNLCETHRCHDIQRDDKNSFVFKECPLYHVKNHDVEPDDADNSSMTVGDNGLLAEVSWRCWKNLRQVPSVVNLNVIERTSLASLNEGVVVGRPYFVFPSVAQETDTAPEDSNLCQLNSRLFQGLCHALHSMDQGLICWSVCNLEKMRETACMYYYILQPSESGPMLLRRLAGAEEILPFPDANIDDSSITEEIDRCIQQCLMEVELKDYNPVQHCGGFHKKLNQLVEENLRLGLVAPEISTAPLIPTCSDDVAVSLQPSVARNVAAPPGVEVVVSSGKDIAVLAVQTRTSDQGIEDDKGISRLTQEWEQLIVGGIPRMDSELSEPNLEKARTSAPAIHKPLDTRTSIILERLGNPRQINTKANTHKILSGLAANGNGTTEHHHSIIDIDATDQGLTAPSNLIRPTFQRLKRKFR
ncbi:uncharacterized protein LOC110698502 isoform X2 [Chenopodium quinoa]|uniref:uncharacterized protein LOC110698502 isoform X2 n=1 Tax=Chenopodium quinoa TaxID=63459 RepID=UPI000B795BBC|nr:uncharacterized protein LOC110698502 isoform X2 [Chenopodium quinoa]